MDINLRNDGWLLHCVGKRNHSSSKRETFRIQDAPDPCPLDPFGCPKHFGILMMPIDLSPETFPVPSSQDDWRMGRNTYVFVSKLMRVGSKRPLSHLGKTFHRRYIRVCLVQFSVRLISRSIIKQRACLVLSRRASLNVSITSGSMYCCSSRRLATFSANDQVISLVCFANLRCQSKLINRKQLVWPLKLHF